MLQYENQTSKYQYAFSVVVFEQCHAVQYCVKVQLLLLYLSNVMPCSTA